MNRLATFVAVVFALALSACVKPKNHDSNIDSAASFYVDEVKPGMDTAETIPGYTIPAARLYTFTACIKDRRTDQQLPGAPFVISGGENDQDIHTDKDGCAVWSEKIAFDYLADEKYLPITRVITAKGSQVGSRTVKLAIDPWSFGKAPVMYDLDHHTPPKDQLATDEQARAVLKSDLSGQTKRTLFLDKLSFENSAVATADGTNSRKFKIYLDPSVTLKDIDGNPFNVAVGVQSQKLRVSAALIESVISGGTETKTVISKTKSPVSVVVENGKTSAEFTLSVRQGTQGSRYSLAIQVSPVEGPKGLAPFDGLFTIGDLRALTELGATTASLNASNHDKTFDFGATVGTLANLSDDVSTPKALGADDSSKNTTSSTNVSTFSMGQFVPTWLGVTELGANRRMVRYRVQTCITDFSNGGRTADGVEFTVQLSDKTWTRPITAGSIDNLHGCITWTDSITHLYYEPEHFFKIPVTIKQKSGYSATRVYAIDPWQNFRTAQDPSQTPEFIESINENAKNLPSYLIADNVEMNSQSVARYAVDDYMSVKFIKPLGIKIPMRVARPSNYVDSPNNPEQLRRGRYLLRASYVTPVAGTTDRTAHLLISPMIGLSRVVDVKGGFFETTIEIPVTDLRLLQARSYFVFQLHLLDENRIPKDDPDLLHAKNPMDYVDRESRLDTPTFATVINAHLEKDAAGVVWNTSELSRLAPTGDSINNAASKHQISKDTQQLIGSLANVSIDGLYAQAMRDQQDYVRRMDPAKTLGVVATRANAEFAFVTNESFNAVNDKTLLANNHLLPPSNHAIDGLLKVLNTPLASLGSKANDSAVRSGGAITRDTLMQAIGGGRGLDPKLANQLCGYFFSIQPRRSVSGFDWLKVEMGFQGRWVDTCLSEIRKHKPDGVFSIDHRLRVLETNGVDHLPGRSDLVLHVADQASFFKSDSDNSGWGAHFGTGGITSELASALTKTGGTAIRFFTAVLGGFGAEMQHSTVRASGTSDGYVLDSGHNLTVDETPINIHVTKSDECIIIRPRASFYNDLESSMHLKILKATLGDQKAETLLNRGLMLCSGTLNTRQRIVNERYYSIASLNQGGNGNDLLDPNNLPWLLLLRGQRDFASFLTITSAVKTSPSDANARVEIGDMSNAILRTAYDNYFAGTLSTMPGFIKLEPLVILRQK